MALRKKNKAVDPVTPEEVAKLGDKHEQEAARDRKSSVYEHFHSQETAEAIEKQRKRKRLYAFIVAALASILLIMYIISMLWTQTGDLTISIGDLGDDGKTLMLCENMDFDPAQVVLDGGVVKEVTNITKSWLPKDIDNEADGIHPIKNDLAKNYLAYTFYLRNTGDQDLNYETVMTVTGQAKSADEAVRFMVYRNGKPSVYAKGQYNDRTKAETDATKWVDDTTIMRDPKEALKAGGTDKFTVVVWCEGNDNECVDAIRGGHVRAQMVFNVVDDEAQVES